MADVAFDSAGNLYGLSGNSRDLFSINTSTGAASSIGDTGIFPFGNAMGFDSGGTLYALPRGGSGNVDTIDTSTGLATAGPALSGSPGGSGTFPAGKFDSSDVFWAWQQVTGTLCHLVTVNVSTGVVTNIAAASLNQTDALAWSPAAGAATKVKFGVQPSAACTGLPISPAVTVRIEDAGGLLVTSSTAAVTVAIGTNPGGGTLSGTLTVNAVAGVATFSDLSINNAGAGYTLVASSSGLTSDTSSAFNEALTPTNDLCANATVLPGVSGLLVGSNVCAGHEAGDPLDGWYGGTCKNTVFYSFTSPVRAYLQLELEIGSGSSMTDALAGVAHGTCGSLAISGDDVLNTPAYRERTDGGPPGPFGTIVEAGETVVVEVAVESIGTPGEFTLTWELLAIVLYDCPGATSKVGPDLLASTPASHVQQWNYCQTDDGAHWVAYFYDDTPSLGTTQEYHLARLDPGTLIWDDHLVHTIPGTVADGLIPFAGCNIATDGTEVWAAFIYRHDDGPNPTEGVKIYAYNGGAYTLVGTLLGLDNNLTGGGHFNALPAITADPGDPGVCYAMFSSTDGGGGNRDSELIKVDNAGTLWTNTILGVAYIWGGLSNWNGDAIGWLSDFDVDESLTMSRIDPSTGALTTLQTLTYAGLGFGSGVSPHWVASTIIPMSRAFADPVVGADAYYVAFQWRSPLGGLASVYAVKADGSAAFDYMNGDIADSSINPIFNLVAETNNVWGFGQILAEQFDRKCFDGWNAWAESPGFGSKGALVGDNLYSSGRSSGISFTLAVWVAAIARDGCDCPTPGPPITAVGTPGAPINVRFRLS